MLLVSVCRKINEKPVYALDCPGLCLDSNEVAPHYIDRREKGERKMSETETWILVTFIGTALILIGAKLQ